MVAGWGWGGGGVGAVCGGAFFPLPTEAAAAAAGAAARPYLFVGLALLFSFLLGKLFGLLVGSFLRPLYRLQRFLGVCNCLLTHCLLQRVC